MHRLSSALGLGLGLLLGCSGGDAPDAGTPSRDGGTSSPRDAGPELDAGSEVQVTFRVEVPANTPDDGPVHIAGDFQGWDPADPAYALTEVEPNVHEIVLDLEVGTALAFKFARGDWTKVEKSSSGAEIADRRLTVTGPAVETFIVGSWADASPLPSTLTGNVTTVTVPGLLEDRRVWIYLPPTYDDDPAARFSVLYMLDGQNLFDQRTSFAGEWEVDEALESLISAGEVEPLIVVGVDNGGPARIDEYTPWMGAYQGEVLGGGGQAHLQTLIDVLKPWVDGNYRTQPGPGTTGFAGSSLGGLMALYTAYARPDVFGRVAALSPSIWWDDGHVVQFITERAKPPRMRLWVDIGTEENASRQRFQTLSTALQAAGFRLGEDLQFVVDEGAGHNEAAWRRRMPDVLRFLFPAQ